MTRSALSSLLNKTRIKFFQSLTLYCVFVSNSVLENANPAYSFPLLQINTPRKFYETSLIQNRNDGPTYNVIDVWNKNITGAGVVVAVVDEGFDPQHPEIYDNYLHVSHYILRVYIISIVPCPSYKFYSGIPKIRSCE